MPGNPKQTRPWISGGERIGRFAGINRRDIAQLVETEALPAFKWRGRWRALPEDLTTWTRKMVKKYGRTRGTAPTRTRGKAPTGRPHKIP